MTEPEEIMKLYQALIASPFILFPSKGDVLVSSEQGVYIIYNPRNIVFHVGTTKYGKEGLNQRLSNHLSSASSFSRNYLKPNGILLRDGYKFKYLAVNNSRTRALLEALTAGLLCPAHFGTGEKKETPSGLRLLPSSF